MTKRSVRAEAVRYLALPYTRELVPEDDGTWYARVVELPGCMTVGDAQADALASLDDAMATWIESRLEDGEPVPEPAADYSGRFVVRVPKALHRDLVSAAARNGSSLNLFVATALAQAVGSPTVSFAPEHSGKSSSGRQSPGPQ